MVRVSHYLFDLVLPPPSRGIGLPSWYHSYRRQHAEELSKIGLLDLSFLSLSCPYSGFRGPCLQQARDHYQESKFMTTKDEA